MIVFLLMGDKQTNNCNGTIIFTNKAKCTKTHTDVGGKALISWKSSTFISSQQCNRSKSEINVSASWLFIFLLLSSSSSSFSSLLLLLLLFNRQIPQFLQLTSGHICQRQAQSRGFHSVPLTCLHLGFYCLSKLRGILDISFLHWSGP